jgi:hypothetical protein
MDFKNIELIISLKDKIDFVEDELEIIDNLIKRLSQDNKTISLEIICEYSGETPQRLTYFTNFNDPDVDEQKIFIEAFNKMINALKESREKIIKQIENL